MSDPQFIDAVLGALQMPTSDACAQRLRLLANLADNAEDKVCDLTKLPFH